MALVVLATGFSFELYRVLAGQGGLELPGASFLGSHGHWALSALSALLYARPHSGHRQRRFPGRGWARHPVDGITTGLLTGLCVLGLNLLLAPADTPLLVWVALWLATVLLLIPGFRIGSSLLLRHLVRTQRVRARVLAVVGATDQARELVHATPRSGAGEPVRYLGLFDDRAGDERITREVLSSISLRGSVRDLVELARHEPPDEIIIALPHSAPRRIAELTQALSSIPADLSLCPDLASWLDRSSHPGTTALEDQGLIRLHKQPHREWNAVAKFLEDKLIAGLALAVLTPVMLVIGLAIRCEGPGPMLFRQRRFGFNNEAIEVLKFRTMHWAQGDPSGARRTTRDDPRVTRIGRVLRRTSLDELPQLINVLRGDMSIVGPRAHAVAMQVLDRPYEDVVQAYAARHRVKPGITGLAQVNGLRGEVDTLEKACRRVELDLAYIRHWSVGLDFRIMLRTLTHGLPSRDAR